MNETFDITEKMLIQLGNYINQLREERGIGFNQLALMSNLNVRTLNDILNAKIKKINPFHLKRIARVLKIDYKELYRIVGYLDNGDLFDINTIEEIKKLRKELEECRNQLNIESNSNNGHIIVGDGNKINHSYAGTELCKEMNELSEKEKEKVLKFINDYIKN
ncbi:MAG: helix-turn-helix domain-containing protein [Cetobacterium sp.]|uniref:helix-turn-helix domain-containing protein n=1 Tax=Cetobacterium sp. TaxID=2071632 RepID=UPI003F345236